MESNDRRYFYESKEKIAAALTLTGDCYVTTLSNLGTINFNGHTIHLADGSTLTA